MDLQLVSRQIVAPDPRPVMTGPSTAVQEQDPKPAPGETKPSRRHDHPRAHGKHRERGRSHVQQGLHHIVREIRQVFREELKAGLEAGEIDLDTMGSIRELQSDFRHDLRAVFREAGSPGGIDRNQVLEGMVEALQGLADGLRALTGGDVPEATPQPEKLELEPAVLDEAPGSLLDVTV